MESFIEIYKEAINIIKDKISQTAFDVWIKPIEPVKLENDNVYLFIKSEFQKKIINDKYKKHFISAFEQVLGFSVGVFVFSETASLSDFEPDLTDLKEHDLLAESQKAFDSSHSPRSLPKSNTNSEYEYTFDTFIVGSSNEFACSACRGVVKGENNDYNPLFIYGPSGLGKTHLLMAIKHSVEQKNPGCNIIYITGEQFTSELVSAIQNNSTSVFKNKFRSADFLLTDDIQFLSGKTRSQEEFFYTFNELFQLGKQIVITSDRPPNEIKSIEDRMYSRFEWGIIADISPPDFETRVAIIQRKAQLLNIDIPHDVIEYIANRIKTNIRQLEGAVKKIKAYKILTQTLPSISMAQIIIKDIMKKDQPVSVTIEKILQEVSQTYDISVSEILSKNRSSKVSFARQTAIYITKEVTGITLDMMGEQFGGRDHATILYSLNKVKNMLKDNFRYREIVNDIINNIKNSM